MGQAVACASALAGVASCPLCLLQAFVKMVGHHVSFLEAHVLQAERDHGAFPQALQRWLGTMGLPSFRNVSNQHLPPPAGASPWLCPVPQSGEQWG